MGRRSLRTPWENFCRRLSHSVSGTFYEFGVDNGVGSAHLTVEQAADAVRARELCKEFGVLFALDGVAHASDLDATPVLWVEAGHELGQFKRIADDSPYWFVQPGCLLGELDAAGLRQFGDLPAHITVAAWLADRSLCDWHSGQTHKSGLINASVMLADGSQATLGPFGENNKKPLEGMTLQRMVPSLFELSNLPGAQACRRSQFWPARYRLDALLPEDGQTVNLAHLLLGHGGDLGWVNWVVLDERVENEMEVTYIPRFSTTEHDTDDETWVGAADVDSQVKYVFDPDGVFPCPGQDL
jgi:hypothetical protein